jgi:phospholipid/cholesterol/gamma-HCH transport system permease protein
MVFLRPITLLSARVAAFVQFIGGVGYLLGDTVAAIPRGLVARRGRRLAWSNLWAQMVRVGVRSVPIVMLVLFCIGAILALQMAPVLRQYNATSQVANVISIAVFREMGPLVSAIVLTGFAGASIAAEMGAMVVSEEIEALEAEAISPVRFLVLPRVLATTLMMVCVAVVGDLTGIIGGLVVSTELLNVSHVQYIHRTFESVRVHDFASGLIKSAVFGILISALACFLGLRVTGGAQGVGVATTRTVVLTIVSLIAVDLMFTAVFYFYGW